MRSRVLPLVVVVLLAGVGIAVTVWSAPYVSTARSLFLFERETPTQVVEGSARQGIGLLGLDVVTLADGRVVDVLRRGEPRVQWPRPAFLVGDNGARYADEPPSSGAWQPFALRASAAWLVALLTFLSAAPWLVRRLPGAVEHLGFVIFGQRDPESRPVTFVPGSGGIGGGGQVPPVVPYDADWDPENRIR